MPFRAIWTTRQTSASHKRILFSYSELHRCLGTHVISKSIEMRYLRKTEDHSLDPSLHHRPWITIQPRPATMSFTILI